MAFKRAGLYPSDLDLCQRVFDQLCTDEKISPSSEAGETLAMQIVAAFQETGSNDADLLEVVRGPRLRPGIDGEHYRDFPGRQSVSRDAESNRVYQDCQSADRAEAETLVARYGHGV